MFIGVLWLLRTGAPWADRAASPTPADVHFDAVFVNAGATEILSSWLDRLAEGGRLLVPLTTRSIDGIGGGRMSVVQSLRRDDHYARTPT